MPGNLPLLAPTAGHVEVQDTAFTRDTLGRYICNTLEEATTNDDFDAVVIGAGTYGGFCAERIFRGEKRLRVLVLDAGSFLVPEHLQNLPRLDLYNPPASDPVGNAGAAHSLVWGFPFRSNYRNGGQPYCLGGRSVYWSGWAARLTDTDLKRWPPSVADDLRTTYARVEAMIGRGQPAGFLDGPLTDALEALVQSGGANRGVERAPVAACGTTVPGSRLFGLDKFSTAGLLIEAVRDAVRERFADAERRLFVVPGVRVVRLVTDHQNPLNVTALEVSVNGGPVQRLPVRDGCSVVLALGAVESTRLVLESVPRSPIREDELIGSNLMGHLRSRTVLRVRRQALQREGAAPWAGVQSVAALMVRGEVEGRSYHLEITAVDDETGPSGEHVLYHAIPDLGLFQHLVDSRQPGWVSVAIQGYAEMSGVPLPRSSNRTHSWVDLSPYPDARDEHGKPRAWVQMGESDEDRHLFDAMTQHVTRLVESLGQAADVEVLLPAAARDDASTMHESGSLWMGDKPETSVASPGGRLHHVHNLFCADQALFPSVGSVGPVLTGLALADRVAREVIGAHQARPPGA